MNAPLAIRIGSEMHSLRLTIISMFNRETKPHYFRVYLLYGFSHSAYKVSTLREYLQMARDSFVTLSPEYIYPFVRVVQVNLITICSMHGNLRSTPKCSLVKDCGR